MSTQTLRVVSLLPSATDTVVALGLEPILVGRSHEVHIYPLKLPNTAAIHRPPTD